MEKRARERELKRELDLWYEKTNTADFIASDPVQFPRAFKKREDIEIAAFLTAAIAWGRRDLIMRSAEKMFSLMGESPYEYVMSGACRKLGEGNIHRTFFEGDLKYFCRGFKRVYVKYGNLEKLFSSVKDVWEGIALFREEMAAANKGEYTKHVAAAAPLSSGGSACKRVNLALRWLAREGPVDLHLWSGVKPSALFIPLDVHVARMARKLGLLKRKSNDRKAVIELTEKLREFCPEDPVKYDFALFAMGKEMNRDPHERKRKDYHE